MKLKIAYFGSPDFAADFLEKILLDKSLPVEVKLIITQPDQKVGRKQILTPTPVKKMANKYKVQIIELRKWKMGLEAGQEDGNRNLNQSSNILLPNSFPDPFSTFQNIDLSLVYAYGDLIPKELLSLPKYGFWNIHPSLLPKYRGPSPIATPLINGDKTTGVTLIKMDEEIDHGPIIAQESYTIKDTDYRPDLEKKLTNLALEMLKEIIKNVILGSEATPESLLDSGLARMTTIPQNHSNATYTKKLGKKDGFISFANLKNVLKPTTSHQSLITLYNLFRGLTPWPGIWTILPNGKRLKITDMSLTTSHQPLITKVQLEGKNEVDFETFNKAYKIF